MPVNKILKGLLLRGIIDTPGTGKIVIPRQRQIYGRLLWIHLLTGEKNRYYYRMKITIIQLSILEEN